MEVSPRVDPSRIVPLLVGCVVLALAALLPAASPASAQDASAQTAEQQVADAVCDAQIVLLGELPSHGEARTFQAKAKIVESLVRRCGFTSVLFEAPVYDFLGFQQAIAEGRADQRQLDAAIGGFWMSQDLLAWREWLFSQATAGRSLVGGLDDQVSASSEYARATLPNLVAASVPGDRGPTCREAVMRNLYWTYDAEHQFDQAEKERLQQCARLAAESLDLETDSGPDLDQLHMLQNLANLYDRQLNASGAQDRDERMYRNILWHLEQTPAQTKLVVWTATVHAARQQGELRTKPLGAWLADEWGDDLASIGFTAFAGHSSMAGMPSRALPEAPSGSLEALATESETSWVYLDASALRYAGVVESRLLGRFTAADWSDYFDGVMVIRKEVAPDWR